METATMPDRLAALGFTQAAKTFKTKQAAAEKMRQAYAQYLFVPEATIQKFRERLAKDTGRQSDLVFTALADYPEVPPTEALDALEAAQLIGCFDTFEVASIQAVVKVPDPILFGRVTGCNDRFFIAQWDDDVTVEQLLFQDGPHDRG